MNKKFKNLPYYPSLYTYTYVHTHTHTIHDIFTTKTSVSYVRTRIYMHTKYETMKIILWKDWLRINPSRTHVRTYTSEKSRPIPTKIYLRAQYMNAMRTLK